MNVSTGLKAFSLIALLFSVGCATQHQEVSSESFVIANTVDGISVLVVSDDTAERAEYENQLTRELSAIGIRSEASHLEIPRLVDFEKDSAVVDMYAKTNTNMGLTVEVIEARNETAMKAEAAGFGLWLTGIVLGSDELRAAGHVAGFTGYRQGGKYELRVTLWDGETGKQVWTVDTKSFTNDRSSRDMEELAKLVQAQLNKHDLTRA